MFPCMYAKVSVCWNFNQNFLTSASSSSFRPSSCCLQKIRKLILSFCIKQHKLLSFPCLIMSCIWNAKKQQQLRVHSLFAPVKEETIAIFAILQLKGKKPLFESSVHINIVRDANIFVISSHFPASFFLSFKFAFWILSIFICSKYITCFRWMWGWGLI